MGTLRHGVDFLRRSTGSTDWLHCFLVTGIECGHGVLVRMTVCFASIRWALRDRSHAAIDGGLAESGSTTCLCWFCWFFRRHLQARQTCRAYGQLSGMVAISDWRCTSCSRISCSIDNHSIKLTPVVCDLVNPKSAHGNDRSAGTNGMRQFSSAFLFAVAVGMAACSQAQIQQDESVQIAPIQQITPVQQPAANQQRAPLQQSPEHQIVPHQSVQHLSTYEDGTHHQRTQRHGTRRFRDRVSQHRLLPRLFGGTTTRPHQHNDRHSDRHSDSQYDWRRDESLNNWGNYDSSLYPKYIGAFHSSHFSNLGIPAGDRGFRGNGIYWTPW